VLQGGIVSSIVQISTPQACAPPAPRSIGNAPAPASNHLNAKHLTVRQAFLLMLREPHKYLLQRWNWKSAVLSSLLRALLFFATNLAAGLPAAIAALQTELVFRGITSGFYGALTEAFREVEPPWEAALTVMFLLPVANHSVELLVHWMRGTQKLFPSILASVVLTAFSTLFNFYVMRRGVLIVGSGRHSLGKDLLKLPRLVVDFVTWGPRYLMRRAGSKSGSGRADGD
jgi:hypothetical protein